MIEIIQTGQYDKGRLLIDMHHLRRRVFKERMRTTDIVRAALMTVNERMNDKVREGTGIRKVILNCGSESESLAPTMVSYSLLRREDDLAA